MDRQNFFISLNYFEYCFLMKKYLAEYNLDIEKFIEENGAKVYQKFNESIAPKECIAQILEENLYNS